MSDVGAVGAVMNTTADDAVVVADVNMEEGQGLIEAKYGFEGTDGVISQTEDMIATALSTQEDESNMSLNELNQTISTKKADVCENRNHCHC